jgi:dTDP-4-dehydrorhamnose 3,5-epimerase
MTPPLFYSYHFLISHNSNFYYSIFMQVTDLRLHGLKLISVNIFHDERGFFFESYAFPKFAKNEISVPFVQDNISYSKKGTVRALHFQSEPGQAKLVSCIRGSIWDVAVDIRSDSLTFGKWEAVLLDDLERRQLFIPVGFAHGFCVLSEDAIVQYKVSAVYNPLTERSIRWNDPDLAISWPVDHPILSERDRKNAFFKEVFA